MDWIVYRFWCNKVQLEKSLLSSITTHTKWKIWHKQMLLNGGSKLNDSQVKFLIKAMSGFIDLFSWINFMIV